MMSRSEYKVTDGGVYKVTQPSNDDHILYVEKVEPLPAYLQAYKKYILPELEDKK